VCVKVVVAGRQAEGSLPGSEVQEEGEAGRCAGRQVAGMVVVKSPHLMAGMVQACSVR